MAHKDNVKNAESRKKHPEGPETGAPTIEEVVEAPVVKPGHHTGVVQISPKVEAAA